MTSLNSKPQKKLKMDSDDDDDGSDEDDDDDEYVWGCFVFFMMFLSLRLFNISSVGFLGLFVVTKMTTVMRM